MPSQELIHQKKTKKLNWSYHSKAKPRVVMLLALDPAPQEAPPCAAGNALAYLDEAMASPFHPATLTAGEGASCPSTAPHLSP